MVKHDRKLRRRVTATLHHEVCQHDANVCPSQNLDHLMIDPLNDVGGRAGRHEEAKSASVIVGTLLVPIEPQAFDVVAVLCCRLLQDRR